MIVGVTEHGRKQLVTVEDGYRESEASWTALLTNLKQRGLELPPKLATGDGALGFWKELLAFCDFPAGHWVHFRTSNPIESTFATVRLRTKRTENCGSRSTTLAMVYRLMLSAQKRRRAIKGFRLLTLVVNNVEFKDGTAVDQSARKAA